ncbi:histone H1 protein [Rutstroemia sp. NJR-2017a BBW]|nr:histone H1 protein [Rutstroemia sp. NJR-2017a BBW]
MPPKAAAPKAKSAAPEHASYQAMITDAIVNLKERNGSSRMKIKKYVRANNNISAADSMFDSLFNRALKAGVQKGVFAQAKGPSGPTKLAPLEKKNIEKKAATDKKAADKPKAVAAKKATTTKKAAADKSKAAEKPKAPKAKAAPAKAKAAAPKEPKEKKPAAAKPKKKVAPKGDGY